MARKKPNELLGSVDRKEAAAKKAAGSKIYKLSELTPEISYYETGIPEIDHRVGGLPPGSILQAGGESGVGKTTIMTDLAVGALAKLPNNERIGIQDFENRMQIQMLYTQCERHGVNVDRISFQQPDSGQEGLKTIMAWLKDDEHTIIIADSLKAIVNEKSQQKAIDKGVDGRANQKLVNDFLEKIVALVKRKKKTLIFIDHLKKKSVSFGGREFTKWDTASGVSIKFYSSAIWHLKKTKPIYKTTQGERDEWGAWVKLEVKKTTVSPMTIIENILLRFRDGVSSWRWYANKSIEYECIKRTGKGNRAKFSYKDEVIATSPKKFREWCQGDGAKIWKAICRTLNKKEHEKYLIKATGSPPLLVDEFKLDDKLSKQVDEDLDADLTDNDAEE